MFKKSIDMFIHSNMSNSVYILKKYSLRDYQNIFKGKEAVPYQKFDTSTSELGIGCQYTRGMQFFLGYYLSWIYNWLGARLDLELFKFARTVLHAFSCVALDEVSFVTCVEKLPQAKLLNY